MNKSASHPTAGENWLGRRLEVLVGPIAHGGHCVARHDGRVIFVRHALPGERVTVLITEDRGGSFCRADAVEIWQAAPDRVQAPCRHARPAGCGGCDFQHVSLAGQRRLKAAVIGEQLNRLAGLDVEVEVRALDATGLGWRRRIRYAVAPDGGLGLKAHRSHEVIEVGRCPLGAPGVGDADALGRKWPGLAEVEVVVDDQARVALVGHRQRQAPAVRGGTGRRGTGSNRTRRTSEHLDGPERMTYRVSGRDFEVRAGGFWQTHPAAAETFVSAVLAGADVRSGDRVLDLYAGAGLFSVPLADAVTQLGALTAVEADRRAAADARANLSAHPWASVRVASVTAASVTAAAASMSSVDVVVLDPPRTGAGRQVLTAILQARPRTVSYVACDPAALARDVRIACDAGWRLAELVAIDAFPMTHHVECIATLRPAR